MSTYNEVNPVKLGSTSQTANSNTNWPESLQKFVNTCFIKSNYLAKNDRIEFQNQLQRLIQKAFEQDKVWENKWEAQKLPIFDKNCLSVDLECNGPPLSSNSGILPIPGSLPLPSSKGKLSLSLKSKKRTSLDELDSDSKRTNGKGTDDYLSKDRKKQRGQRFERELSHSPAPSSNEYDIVDPNKALIGTCKDLEKRYLRLTSAPDPARVRPLPILKKSLNFLLEKYDEDATYQYMCDQLKSVRQDLTVQHIQNDFTVKVYETHARIAIENNDLGEYNQCQSQLKTLYQSNTIKGENKYEFIAYRIIYLIMTQNHNDIFKLKLALDASALKSNVIRDALKLQTAQLTGNYHDFFQIYGITKNKGKKLIEFFIERERIKALCVVSKSYRKIWLQFVLNELKFNNEEECVEFLKKNKLGDFILVEESVNFDCSKARATLEELKLKYTKKVDIKGQV